MKKQTSEDDSNLLAYGIAADGFLVCGCVLYNRYKKPNNGEPKKYQKLHLHQVTVPDVQKDLYTPLIKNCINK